MKLIVAALCGFILASAINASPIAAPAHSGKVLLGAKECTWGPTYWCSNFANAKACKATTHCIQTVWEKKVYPVDNDEICKICLDMVTQARDQLESNETQADLKAVFEGSCNLIPVKVVRKECDKMADDFIPELVEALASQMNPNVVCSVAGLCNNAAIDKLLAETPATKPEVIASKIEKEQFTCGQCNKIATQITNKFHASDSDDVLEQFLRACGQLSSFSDACSSIVLTHFADIYGRMSTDLTADTICHYAGVCADKFHQHEDAIEIRPMSDVGFVSPDVGDDIPCKLCEQLVDHLRDLLVANTTELEFKSVLEGLCKQSRQFKDECMSIVDQYYDVIYSSLVNDIDSNGACFMIGVCPKGLRKTYDASPIMPLLPVAVVQSQRKPPKKLLGENEPKYTNVEIQNAQLPIDRLMLAPNSMQLINNGGMCTVCEYFMHFVQEALSEPKNEDEIKEIVGKTCEKLPKAVSGECHNFVDLYGDAIIALLIQQIDPREICPTLKMCPASNSDIEVFAPEQIEVTINGQGKDKPSCALCLFAMTELQEVIKTDKSKSNIKDALSKLCQHLSAKLKMECSDFIETYSAELVEMLVSDFTPQEICVYLKLCVDSQPDVSMFNIKLGNSNQSQKPNGEIETNEIPDSTVNGKVKTTNNELGYGKNPECYLCRQIVVEIEEQLGKLASKDDIDHALDVACDNMGPYKAKCYQYIDKYGRIVVNMIMKNTTPKLVCSLLPLCGAVADTDELEVDEALVVDYVVEPVEFPSQLPISEPPQCAICEFVMLKLESELNDKKTEAEIEDAVRNVCSKMPKTVMKQCDKMIDQYGNFIIKFLATMPPKQICTKLALCASELERSKLEVIECGVCQGAVQSLDNILKNEKIDTEIENYVEKSCQHVPAKYFKKCTDMVEVYGISMIKQLEKLVEQHQVCVEIGMCQAAPALHMFNKEKEVTIKAVRRSVGASECTWGPTHWCSSKETAAKCKTEKYCMDKKLGKWSA